MPLKNPREVSSVGAVGRGEEKGRARLRPATNFFLQKLHLTSNQDMGEEKNERQKKVVHTGHRGMGTVPAPVSSQA